MPGATLTIVLLLIAAGAVGFIIHRRRHGVPPLNSDDDIERRRGHRHAIGPDGKALLIGRAVGPAGLPPRKPSVPDAALPDVSLPDVSLPDVFLPEPPARAQQRPAQAVPATTHTPAPPRQPHATRVKVRRDRAGGITIDIEGRTFSTPLWGRAPREAARDLYRYAIYAMRLDSGTATRQH